MSRPPHLLLAITSDSDALSLVEHARALAAGQGGSWSVVAIDTPTVASRSPDQRARLLGALDRAQALGATVTRISTGSHTTSALVSALAHRAQSENATALMIGVPLPAGGFWSRGGRGDLDAFAPVLSQLLPGVTVHLVCPPPAAVERAIPAWPTNGDRSWWRDMPRVLLALGVCTATGAALERHLHPANLVMIYLAGVVYVASRAGRAPALTAVIGSIFLYDLIFVAPRWSLKPTEPQYWLAFMVMMVVGLIISQLAARSREQALLAESRAQRTQALNQLSVALGRARDGAAVARALCDIVHSAVGSHGVVLDVENGSRRLRPGQDGPSGFDADWADRALRTGGEVGAGTSAGSDQPLRYVPLMVGETAFGLLAMTPPAAERDTLEDQHLVRSLANQAAVALERADLEQRSIAAAVEAEGERTRNTLLAGLSHDFRTPLTTIVGSATMLIEQAPAIDASQRTQLLQTLLQEARRLHVMTSNLLDLTRLDEGAIQLRPEWCPADELLEAALQQLSPRLKAHQLAVDVPPDALVWCDPRLLDQVLVNLIENAVRHTPPGGWIRVGVALTPTHWTLSVHDNGPGIPPGQEQAIFRKFHRAAGDGDSMGKGLGLALCAAIAALHGGQITAENAEGARFTLTLPQPALPELEPAET